MAEAARIFQFQASVESQECCNCGIVFWVPAHLHRRWRNEGQSFYCPNGHGQSYTDTPIQKLGKELTAMKDDRNWWKGATRAEEKRHSATKGQVTKLRRGIGAGTCPCCNRTFKQLAAHMTRQHPKYGK